MITAHKISKRFGAVQALQDVQLSVLPGEIHGLVGENGAGKSTLMKILAGVFPPDSGDLVVDGQSQQFRSPKEAYDLGIRIVHQELSLVPTLTVAENLFLHEFSSGGLHRVNRRALAARAEGLLREWNLDTSPLERVERLPMGRRQLVEIGREVSKEARLLILDEPTSSLSSREIDHLFEVLRKLKRQHFSVIFISHRLNEVLAIADAITVLRNGKTVVTRPAGELTAEEIVAEMTGREIDVAAALRAAPARPQTGRYNEASVRSEVLLEIQKLSGVGFTDISLQLRQGEILGIAGLMGSGRSELLRTLFGIHPIREGRILLGGRAVTFRNPLDAIQAGLALLPENRADEGVFPELSVAKNFILMKLEEVARGPWLRKDRMKAKTEHLVRTLNVVTYDPHVQLVKQLSGGNQQKVVLGRLLGACPRILLLDEPTRGVDVGTKAEIRRILADFVAQGSGIIMVSSDFSELMAMCDRILVLHRGRPGGSFDRSEFQEEELLKCAMGLSHRALVHER